MAELALLVSALLLREDIRVYADEAMTQQVLTIAARKIIDFSAAYDVVDPTDSRKLGAFRRKGWKSMVRDEWQIRDTADNKIGMIQEDSLAVAFLRRFVAGALLPQTFYITLGAGADQRVPDHPRAPRRLLLDVNHGNGSFAMCPAVRNCLRSGHWKNPFDREGQESLADLHLRLARSAAVSSPETQGSIDVW